MRKLLAIYNQTSNGKWDAFISGYSFISVQQAEDLETARVILRIITAEEIGLNNSKRIDWDITKEHIYKFDPESKKERFNVKT